MKKTFRKQLALFAVIAVMLTVSVFCVAAEGACDVHPKDEIIPVVVAETCTQKGYTYDYCTRCNTIVTSNYDYVAETGHKFEVTYEKNGDSYNRVLTCQNALCKRAENGEAEVIKLREIDEAEYYLVKFENRFESPVNPARADYANETEYAAAVEAHKAYFDADHYVVLQPATWLSESYLTKEYAPEVNATADGTKTSPAIEYISENGAVRLYVKDGEKAVYSANSKTPARNKDKTCGMYLFKGWEADGVSVADKAISANTTFEAVFEGKAPEYNKLSYVFYGAYGKALTTGTGVDYGKKVKYDLAAPVKENDVANTYTFSGWRVGSSSLIYPDVNAQIPLYYDTSITAQFKAETNGYDYIFTNYKGEKLGQTYILYRGALEGLQLKDKDTDRPRDEKYLYAFSGNWMISAVDGYKVIEGTESFININSMTPPATVAVDKNGQRVDIKLDGTQDITLTPHYNKAAVKYHIPIYITPVYFEAEDRFEDDSFVRSDLLDDFNIQVKDANGQLIAAGRTVLSDSGKTGVYTLNCVYSDTLTITAYSDNGKYYGEYQLNLKYVFDTIEETGVGLAPTLSPEWEAGNTHSCNCICHSFLSGIVVRIYNILYRLFNIKYVCCPDLFAAHGSILAYTQNMI